MNIAVIFAGGIGSRMRRTGMPKQFLILGDKPVLIRTIEVFSKNKDVDGIVVVCHKDYINYLCDLIKQFSIQKIIGVVNGGRTGQESIYNGLSFLVEKTKNENIENPLVLLHDGVRPFIRDELVSRCVREAKKFGNCVVAAPAIETIGEIGSEQTIKGVFKRESCLLLKAPQTFFLEDIYKCHVQAIQEGKNNFVDSAHMVVEYGGKLHFTLCEASNIKITTPIDFFTAKALVKNEEYKDIYGI